jgi:hypothetical protein
MGGIVMRVFRVVYDNGWWGDEIAATKEEVRAKLKLTCEQFECRIVSIMPVRGLAQHVEN